MKKKLEKLGAKKIEHNRLMKRFIYDISGENNKWIRLRDEGNKITLSVKSFNQRNKIDSVKEIEVVVDNFEKMNVILVSMGFEKKLYCENYREEWLYENCMISFDSWPQLETFIEIEGNSEKEVHYVVKKLGLFFDNGWFGPVSVIYQKVLGITKEEIKLLKNISFKIIN